MFRAWITGRRHTRWQPRSVIVERRGTRRGSERESEREREGERCNRVGIWGGNRGSIRGHRDRPCTFAAEDLLPDSRLHASLAYCALNGRTLPSTRINAASAFPFIQLKDSATFPKGGKSCARISTLRVCRISIVSPPSFDSSWFCLQLYGRKLEFFFCSWFPACFLSFLFFFLLSL